MISLGPPLLAILPSGTEGRGLENNRRDRSSSLTESSTCCGPSGSTDSTVRSVYLSGDRAGSSCFCQKNKAGRANTSARGYNRLEVPEPAPVLADRAPRRGAAVGGSGRARPHAGHGRRTDRTGLKGAADPRRRCVVFSIVEHVEMRVNLKNLELFVTWSERICRKSPERVEPSSTSCHCSVVSSSLYYFYKHRLGCPQCSVGRGEVCLAHLRLRGETVIETVRAEKTLNTIHSMNTTAERGLRAGENTMTLGGESDIVIETETGMKIARGGERRNRGAGIGSGSVRGVESVSETRTKTDVGMGRRAGPREIANESESPCCFMSA